MAIRTIGIVGAGTMGAGIAQVALEAGHDVLIHDADIRVVDRARERIRDGLSRRTQRLEVEPASIDGWVDERLARLRPAMTIQDVAAASDLVVEAVIEDLAIKRALFRDLDEAAPREAILATNTSALSVAAVAAETQRPDRVVGLHFFNPAPLMALVEVVVAPATDPSIADQATGLIEAWGKTPVRCTDSPGFIVNRVNRPFTLEALAILHAGGATIERIDGLIRAAGFPMGPFELMDLVGLDVNLATARGIYEAVHAAESGGLIVDRFRPSPIQERMVAAGHLGRKMSGGFYRYDAAGRVTGMAPEFDDPEDLDRMIADPDVTDRIILAIVDEAYRALGDGIASVDDIDLALRLGAGHPVGPFERVEGLGGAAGVLEGLRRYAREGPRFDPAPALVAEAESGSRR